MVISWENGEDLKFIQTYSVDEDYLFSFKQEVENNSLGLITLSESNTFSVTVMDYGLGAVFGCPAHDISTGHTDGNGFGNFEFAVPDGFFAFVERSP